MKKQKTKKKINPLARILYFLGQLLLVWVILACVPLTVPRLFGYEVYNVISGSMEPEIPVGSILYIKSIEAESIVVGDVIAFYGPNNVEATVTHRVVENQAAERQFITKGDANEQKDVSPVPYEYLIGRVELSLPYWGNVYAEFITDRGKMTIMGLIVLSVVMQISALYFPTSKKKSNSKEESKLEDSKTA